MTGPKRSQAHMEEHQQRVEDEPTPNSRRDTPRVSAPPQALEGTALYVHLPFCAAKCHYCDFFSVPDEGQDIDGMIAAILREAERRAPARPATLFLGGGTPSLLSAGQLKTLLDGLHEISGWRESAKEVTAECNPESLDVDKARCLLDLGVPRLSIGFQSLDDETLKLFGRVHTAAESFRAYESARTAGIEHVNVDLIYAIPGQTADGWSSDLGRVLDLGPDHLSAYNLTFEEDTRFKRWLDRGRLEAAEEEVELEMFHATRDLASSSGLIAYEISNHARPDEQCRHNVNYWRNGEYVGIGPGAVSKVAQTRSGNPRSISPYLHRIRGHGHATEWSEVPEEVARVAECWWLGLRLKEGVDPAEVAKTASASEAAIEASVALATRLVGDGLLDRSGDRFHLSDRGLPLADGVAREFLQRLSQDTR